MSHHLTDDQEVIKRELGRLREENRQLREENKRLEEFVNECGSLTPESYDSDEAQEQCVLRFLRDMDAMAGTIARLTSAYR
jgi:regulator of replication initiation timing